MLTRSQHLAYLREALASHMVAARTARAAGMPRLVADHVERARRHNRAILALEREGREFERGRS